MTKIDLGLKLKEMYNQAKQGEAVAMIHLFGIKYAMEIKRCPAPIADIAKEAGISASYGTEISKGVKLSKFVNIK